MIREKYLEKKKKLETNFFSVNFFFFLVIQKHSDKFYLLRWISRVGLYIYLLKKKLNRYYDRRIGSNLQLGKYIEAQPLLISLFLICWFFFNL